MDTTTSPNDGTQPMPPARPGHRRIVQRTRGQRHGPIVRLVSPSDLGETIKPFVFLDAIDIASGAAPRFGFHPHSGIATLTLLLDGGFGYEDSSGASGTMERGAVEWMQAGGGVWHRGNAIGSRIRGYQLWVALPPALENAPASSLYLDAGRFGSDGPARVILGQLAGVRSPIPAPSPMQFLDVRLAPGQRWHHQPPAGHDVAWIAVHEGSVTLPAGTVSRGELAVFDDGDAALAFTAADGGAAFVLGSAPRHPHPLVLGSYSVHTSAEALRRGESGIRQVGDRLFGTSARRQPTMV